MLINIFIRHKLNASIDTLVPALLNAVALYSSQATVKAFNINYSPIFYNVIVEQDSNSASLAVSIITKAINNIETFVKTNHEDSQLVLSPSHELLINKLKLQSQLLCNFLKYLIYIFMHIHYNYSNKKF